MPTLIVKSQAEWDALPKAFKEFTIVEIRSAATVTIRACPESSSVVARESSSVVAWESSSVVAWESSSVVAWGSSSVVARESSSVVAWESSSVVAWESSSVVAWGSSSVVARGSSRVVAWESSRVVARESSRVVAWESSRVEARESSSVEARGSSSVVAWESSSVYNQSTKATVLVWACAVVFLFNNAEAVLKSKTATAITPKEKPGTDGWLEKEGIESGESVVLFKRVSKQFQTQEKTDNETAWKIGATLTHKNWVPDKEECGEGKFHACSRPYFCDEFRDKVDDRYIAISINVADLFAWPNPSYPHKIAFRKGKVLFECNRFGEEIKG